MNKNGYNKSYFFSSTIAHHMSKLKQFQPYNGAVTTKIMMLGIAVIMFQRLQIGLRKMLGRKRTKFPIQMTNCGKIIYIGQKFQISATVGCMSSMCFFL